MPKEKKLNILLTVLVALLCILLMWTILRDAQDIAYWRSLLLTPQPEQCIRCQNGDLAQDADGMVDCSQLCLDCRALLAE